MYSTLFNFFGKLVIGKLGKAQQNNRQATFVNLNEAKSICIVFNQNIKEDLGIIQKYVDYLQEWKKSVMLISFSNDENLAKNDLRQIVISPKQLRWNGLPQTENMTQLLQTKFDLLIDLNFDNIICLSYLVLKIEAKLKISNDRDIEIPYHDLYLLTKNEDGVKIFFREMDKYLASIQIKKAS